MKLSSNGKILAVLLVVFVVCDIFLTPIGGLETRSFANTTSIGYTAVVVLFVGLVVNVISLILLFRKPRPASMLAVIGSILFFPALIVDQAGLFSSQTAPMAITVLEWVTGVVLVVVIFFASRVHKENAAPQPVAGPQK